MYKKQFFKNLLINGMNFIVNVAIGLFMAPFLVKQLGIGAFGLVQIATSMSMYASILSTSLNQANNRFISVSLAKDTPSKTITLLNTIFNLYFASFVLILPLIVLISWFPEVFFDIDQEILLSASYMFLFIGISQLLIMQTTAFMSPAYAYNRLDTIQLINILRNALKLFLVFIFILYVSNSLASIGVAFFVASLVASLVAYLNFKKLLPWYRYRLNDFDVESAKKIVYLSGWTAVSVVGGLIFLQTDVVLINMFLGAEESGKFAVLLQWVMLLISISTVLSVVISPLILNNYARKKIDELKSLLYKSIKYQGVFTAIPVAFVFVYADIILKLWLGKEYAQLSVYLQVMIVHFGVTQATRQLPTVNTAYNKMKWHGILTLMFGFFHILVSVLLLRYSTYGIWGVIASNVSFTIMLNMGVLSWYVSKNIKEPVTKIYINLLPAIATQIFMTDIGFLLKDLLSPSSWIMLVVSLGLNCLLVIPFIYIVILNEQEQQQLYSLLKSKIW